LDKAGNNRLAKMPMMAITTSSSINVKAREPQRLMAAAGCVGLGALMLVSLI
jgi:hypothetical protein